MWDSCCELPQQAAVATRTVPLEAPDVLAQEQRIERGDQAIFDSGECEAAAIGTERLVLSHEVTDLLHLSARASRVGLTFRENCNGPCVKLDLLSICVFSRRQSLVA